MFGGDSPENLVTWQQPQLHQRMSTVSQKTIPVIDVFAGPGGLNEGFSRLGEDQRDPVFTTVGSFEMESSAIATLRLRGAYRELLRSEAPVPDAYYDFIRGSTTVERLLEDGRVRRAFKSASEHVHQVELGAPDDDSHTQIERALLEAGAGSGTDSWALIGGPPCQAYSLAGRSRRANDETFATDKKHFLYREYLAIIEKFRPSVFVMENVKGLLSSRHDGTNMFERIKRDLELDGAYSLFSLVSDRHTEELTPSDFIIRSELYGVPQKRHRVILLGVRKDVLVDGRRPRTLVTSSLVSVGDALAGMPALRSGISPARLDNDTDWYAIRRELSTRFSPNDFDFATRPTLTRGGKSLTRTGNPTGELGKWLLDGRLEEVIQHHSRAHMKSDLERYFFAARHAATHNSSPKLKDFDEVGLLPKHKNAAVEDAPFNDRFRVQRSSDPSSTVVSHIAKDGHYYIHPDPSQMRSLTVREAARLQTFPDNYFFCGTRTQQYHQVGNAVPPLLATKIAGVVRDLLMPR